MKRSTAYVDQGKKEPEKPARWWCAICHRVGRDENLMTIEVAREQHAAVIKTERREGPRSQCEGDVRLNDPENKRRRVEQIKPPELPYDGGLEIK